MSTTKTRQHKTVAWYPVPSLLFVACFFNAQGPKNHLSLKRIIIFQKPACFGFQPLIYQSVVGVPNYFPTTLLKINMSLQKRDHSKDKVLFQASIFSFVGCIASCLTETSHIPRKSQVSAIQEQTTPTIIPLVDSVASVSNVLCDDCTLVFFVVFFGREK